MKKILFFLTVFVLIGSHSFAQTSFIVILIDDQRWDTFWAMPILQQKLLSSGVNFKNAFVSTPWCCPARGSFLSGGYYPHNTLIVRNNYLHNDYNDSDTIATRLFAEGYKTGYVGKYMNGYEWVAPYVPPGWSHFVATAEQQGGLDWFDFTVTVGQSDLNSSMGTIEPITQYVTDFHRDEALSFLDGVGTEPYFLYISTHAVHSPNALLPQDQGLFSDYTYTGRGYGEQDFSDKPSWVIEELNKQGSSWEGDCRNAHWTATFREILSSLQAVDRMVGAIVDKVEQIGRTSDTVIIYTSDNGLMWGEHGLCGKGKPYEEALRVPFLMVAPGTAPRDISEHVVANLDLGSTIYDLAGLSLTTDGMSLMPLINNTATNWRDDFLIQSYNDFLWAGLRVNDVTGDWKYVEHPTGEKELYDLLTDPFEEQSLHADGSYAQLLDAFATRLDDIRGLQILEKGWSTLPEAIINVPYYYQIPVWGGTEPYSWDIAWGNLPTGLTLDPISGIISGIPTVSGDYTFSARVTGSSSATHALIPEWRKMVFIIPVSDLTGPPDCDNLPACGNLPIRISGTPPTYYSVLQTSYDAALDGDTLQIRSVCFTEDFTANKSIAVALDVGYDCDYNELPIGTSVLNGNMTVNGGTVKIQRGAFILQ